MMITTYFGDYLMAEITLDIECIKDCSAQGSVDDAVEYWVNYYQTDSHPDLKKQWEDIDPDKLIKDLSGYGAWDDDELADHDENLKRMLWLACSDVREELFNEFGR